MSEYAIIRTGGKQYRVEPGDVLRVEKLDRAVGQEVEFDEVLLAAREGKVEVGTPLLPRCRVLGEVLAQGKSRKVLVFKKKRRKNYRRRYGHRQPYTEVRITKIETGGSHGA
ncbi:MAG: 50S ribosomal protein L21 [Candidatus Binatia bacterium]|nr:MAG: 50S ribosomal protein L21 [Candidatus Binatia bacterium]